MTGTQHTPGPWRNDWQFIVAPDPNGIHQDIYIAEIAESDDDGRVATLEQQVANARLIAAAPAMLSALYEAQDQLEQFVASDKYGRDTDLGKALKEVREAIIMATER